MVAELETLTKPAIVSTNTLEQKANKLCVNDLIWSSIDVAVQSSTYISNLQLSNKITITTLLGDVPEVG